MALKANATEAWAGAAEPGDVMGLSGIDVVAISGGVCSYDIVSV